MHLHLPVNCQVVLLITSPMCVFGVCADGRQVLSAECEHAGKGQGGMAKGTREGMRGTTLEGSQNSHQACVVQCSLSMSVTFGPTDV